MSFLFYGEEFDEINGLAKRCYKYVRRKYPPVEGESKEEWRNFIISETYLEMAARLEEIATRRQRLEIELKYGGRD